MKKWAEWLLVAGALCMGMAGCGSEEKNTSNADAEQKSETASETREEGQSQNMQRRDSLSQILQRCSLNFAVVQVDGQRILPLRRMALFPAYITIQIWGIPGMAIRMEPCITAIFQDISRT